MILVSHRPAQRDGLELVLGEADRWEEPFGGGLCGLSSDPYLLGRWSDGVIILLHHEGFCIHWAKDAEDWMIRLDTELEVIE